MKKLLFILLFIPFVTRAQVIVNGNGEQQSAAAAKGVMPDTAMRGGHQFFNDTLGRNAIPYIGGVNGRRRLGMWVTTFNNLGSDGVKTTWYLKTLSASNGSNWGQVQFGTTYTFANGVKAPGNVVQLDRTYTDGIYALNDGSNAVSGSNWPINVGGYSSAQRDTLGHNIYWVWNSTRLKVKIDANLYPIVPMDISGNSSTATALQTARTINGVSFDGTANITIPNGSTPSLAAVTAVGNTTTSNIGIGTTSPLSALHVATTATTTPRGILSDQNTSDGLGARITMRKSRGTPTSPTVITTGDILGTWTGAGHDGTNYIDAGKILVTSSGTVSTGIVPSIMSFQTMTAAGALTNGFSIDQSQLISFPHYTTNGGLFFGNGSGVIGQTGAGSATTVLHGGTNPSYSAVALTSDVTGVLPTANGGTGSATQNFVDLTTAQTIAGKKSLTDSLNVSLAVNLHNTTNAYKATMQRDATTLTLNNQTFGVAGPGNAFRFPNSTMNYSTIDTSLPSGSNPTISVSFWFKSTTASNSPILNYGGTGSGSYNITISSAGVTVRNGSTVIASSATSVVDGIRHQALCVSDGTSTKVYVDNVLKVTGTALGTITPNGTMINNTASGSGYNPDCTMDQLVMWNTALTAGNETSIWASGTGTATLPGTPILRYDIDDGAPSQSWVNTGSLGSSYNITLNNYSNGWQGVGNGFVPTAGVSAPVIGNIITSTNGIGSSSGSNVVFGNGVAEVTLQALAGGILTPDGGYAANWNSNGLLVDQSNTALRPTIDAQFKLGAGVTGIGGAPLKMTAGPDLTTGELGAFNFNATGNAFKFVPSGTTYKRFLYYTDATATTSQSVVGDGSGGFTLYTLPSFLRLTGSGTGSATTISIPHGLTGITAASIVNITAINAASAGFTYVTADATNINIVYTTAPVSGTNNLSFNASIKP